MLVAVKPVFNRNSSSRNSDGLEYKKKKKKSAVKSVPRCTVEKETTIPKSNETINMVPSGNLVIRHNLEVDWEPRRVVVWERGTKRMEQRTKKVGRI